MRLAMYVIILIFSCSVLFSQNDDKKKANEFSVWVQQLVAKCAQMEQQNKQLVTKAEKATQLEKQLTTANNKIKEQTGAITKLSNEKKQLETTNTSLKKTNIDLKTQAKQFNGKISTLETEKNTLETELLDTLNLIASAETKLESAKKYLEKIRDEYLIPAKAYFASLSGTSNLIGDINTLLDEKPTTTPSK